MTQQIEVNGEIHEFPDEATPEQINIALGGKPESYANEQYAAIKQQHPYLAKLSEALQSYPEINKAIEATAPYAEHFNRAVQGTGLPNLSKGFFKGGETAVRLLGDLAQTGAGPKAMLPATNISSAEIPVVNPHIQQGAEITGEIAPFLSSPSGARAVVNAAGDLPLTRNMAARALNESREFAKAREIGDLGVDKELIQDMKQFLPDTKPYRDLLKKAMKGDYESLFKLQSDVGKRAPGFLKSLLSFAERDYGKEALASRGRLIDAMREGLAESGHKDIADLMQHGQNRYRQYKQFAPYRNAAGLYGLSKTPVYSHVKKLLGL